MYSYHYGRVYVLHFWTSLRNFMKYGMNIMPLGSILPFTLFLTINNISMVTMRTCEVAATFRLS
jgi:hypothetical protein